VYHCLSGPGGYLKDHSDSRVKDGDDLWTQDPGQSLRFLCVDPAAARVKMLAHLIPGLTIRLVSFQYASAGAWVPLDE